MNVPSPASDWCAVVLAVAVPRGRAGLGTYPRRAGADLWAFWMQLATGEGEKIESFPERG